MQKIRLMYFIIQTALSEMKFSLLKINFTCNKIKRSTLSINFTKINTVLLK